MRLLKAILNQAVDIIFLLITLGLLIWHMIDQSKDFTTFLALVVAYVAFNIANKVRLSMIR